MTGEETTKLGLNDLIVIDFERTKSELQELETVELQIAMAKGFYALKTGESVYLYDLSNAKKIFKGGSNNGLINPYIGILYDALRVFNDKYWDGLGHFDNVSFANSYDQRLRGLLELFTSPNWLIESGTKARGDYEDLIFDFLPLKAVAVNRDEILEQIKRVPVSQLFVNLLLTIKAYSHPKIINFAVENHLFLSLEADDRLVNDLLTGDDYWAGSYSGSLVMLEYFRYTDSIQGDREDNQKIDVEALVNPNLEKARLASAEARKKVKQEKDEKRIDFAEREMTKNPQLNNSDLVRMYQGDSDLMASTRTKYMSEAMLTAKSRMAAKLRTK